MTIPKAVSSAAFTDNVKRTVLSNGLTVITKELHTHPIVATMIWYRVGARNEELGQTGKSHFLEHMLFKGTDKYKKGEIDLITMKNGGRNNAFTWLDFTAYYFTFASDRWEIALEVEASRMRNTIFSPEEFASEKQVVIEELQIGQDGPWDTLEEEVWASAFRQHPYHNPTIGWLEDVLNTTVEDMRDYYDKWYHPRNAIIVAVGDFETEKAVAKIEELFGAIPPGPEPKPVHIVEPPQKGEKRVVVKKPTPVERIMIAYHVPDLSHPDSYPLQVATMLLSSGRRSRLYQRLQEKDRSVTFARASYNDHIDPSLFYFQAELKPGYSLNDVEKSLLEVIEDLKQNTVSETELAKAKRQIESNFILGNENALEQAMLLGQFETIAGHDRFAEDERGYLYLNKYLDHIHEVTAADIQRVMNEYFTDKNRTVGHLVAEPAEEAVMISESQDPGFSQHDHPISRSLASIAANSAFLKNPKGDLLFAQSETRKLPAYNPNLDIERLILPNGIILVLGESHTIPSVSIYGVVNTGSRYEPDEKTGLTSLLGEVLDEGTKKRDSQQIAEEIEQVGGHLQSFGGYAQSGISVTVLKPDFDLALDLAVDLLTSATFPQDRFEQQRDRRLAQLKSREDDPRTIASDIFNEIVYKGHPSHKPKIGYPETVKSLTREDLADFYNRFFIPNNTLIAVVGDIDKAEVKAKVEDAFRDWKPVENFKLPTIAEVERQTSPIKKVVYKEKEQVNIYIGHLGITRNNPDYYALIVLDTILGSSPGFTSRIPRILRDEQGLAYTTFSNISGSAGIDPGRFIAYIGTSPENMDKAIDGIVKEIDRITKEPVTESELQDAVDYLTGSFVFSFETNAQVAGFLVEAEIFKLDFDYLKRYPEFIRAVTVEDVFRVAKKYIDPENLTTVIVGPIKQ